MLKQNEESMNIFKKLLAFLLIAPTQAPAMLIHEAIIVYEEYQRMHKKNQQGKETRNQVTPDKCPEDLIQNNSANQVLDKKAQKNSGNCLIL